MCVGGGQVGVSALSHSIRTHSHTHTYTQVAHECLRGGGGHDVA